MVEIQGRKLESDAQEIKDGSSLGRPDGQEDLWSGTKAKGFWDEAKLSSSQKGKADTMAQ